MSNDRFSWDYHRCDWPDCGDLATHELWLDEEMIRRYCPIHANEKAGELAWYWHVLRQAAQQVEEGKEATP